MPVAPLIVNDVSYVRRTKDDSHCSWLVQFGDAAGCTE